MEFVLRPYLLGWDLSENVADVLIIVKGCIAVNERNEPAKTLTG